MFNVRSAFPKFEYQLYKVGAGLKLHIGQGYPLCGIGQTTSSRIPKQSITVAIEALEAPEREICLACRVMAQNYSAG